jgi:hypothetical protein
MTAIEYAMRTASGATIFPRKVTRNDACTYEVTCKCGAHWYTNSKPLSHWCPKCGTTKVGDMKSVWMKHTDIQKLQGKERKRGRMH